MKFVQLTLLSLIVLIGSTVQASSIFIRNITGETGQIPVWDEYAIPMKLKWVPLEDLSYPTAVNFGGEKKEYKEIFKVPGYTVVAGYATKPKAGYKATSNIIYKVYKVGQEKSISRIELPEGHAIKIFKNKKGDIEVKPNSNYDSKNIRNDKD